MAHYKGASSEASRRMMIERKREQHLEEIEHRKRQLEDKLKVDKIDKKFKTHYDAIEQQLKTTTVGLVTLDEMKAKQEDAVKAREQEIAQKKAREEEKRLAAERDKELHKKTAASKLSFNIDEDLDEDDDDKDEEEEFKRVIKLKFAPAKLKQEDDSNSNSSDVPGPSKSLKAFKKVTKNPDVDTSFLPDRQREEEEKKIREKLRLEWVEKQEQTKNEIIEIVYSYWDGSGHRREVTCRKGHTIYQFLQKALDALKKEFPELRIVSADQLMYIKEDLIIPHHYTFYDFIVTKARGKSGPLFSFDVHDDIRLVADANLEKDESHAGKVLLRSWYDRNKHIFPASRWEPYDPAKNYSKYTISDKNK